VAVAFDAVGPSATGTNSGTSPLTWTHTLVSGASTVVLAFVTADSANDSSMSIACTCGGVSMSPVATVHSNSGTVGFGTLFQLTAVTSGAKTITATVTGGSGLDAMSGGSISFTGVNQSTPLGTPVTNTSSGASTPATAALASNTNGNLIAGFAVAGSQFSSATAPSTSRFISPSLGATNGAGGYSVGATSPATGSSVTMAWVISGADDWGVILAEVLPLFSSGGQYEKVPQQLSRITKRRRGASQRPQFAVQLPTGTVNPTTITATASVPVPTLPSPYTGITGLAGSGINGYFTDKTGAPRFLLIEQAWALPWNAGRWNSGNWQADYTTYFSNRSAQGYTAWYGTPWSNDHVDATCLSGGRTWDGIYPITVNGTPGKITTGSETITLNNTFWTRIDAMINTASSYGIACFFVLGMQYDFTGTNDIWFNMSTAQATTFGSLVAARYPKSAWPGVFWFFGDDGSGGQDTFFTNMLASIRTAGDTSPVSTEQLPETSSHIEFDTSAIYIPGGFGITSANYNWVYTYDPSYNGVEKTYIESGTTLLPVVWGDGVWYGDNSSTQNIADYTERRFHWWALASGARGTNATSGPTTGGSIWQWQTGSAAAVTTDPNGTWCTTVVKNVISYFTSLPGWYKLIPDTSNVLVTAGRGTKTTNSAPGFNAAKYGDTDNYVAASRVADGSLAVIYCGQFMSITIDQTKMAAGYTATWVDPASLATSPATTGTTYNSTPKGNNSAGNPDWVLVLQAPANAATGALPASPFPPGWFPGAPGEPGSIPFYIQPQAPAPSAAVTFTGTASIAGAGATTALATEQPPGTAAGAGAATALAAEQPVATTAGAGAVTALATQIAPGTAAGAAAVADVVTEQPVASAAGLSSVADVVTQIATAAAAGAGAATAAGNFPATGAAAGAGAVAAVVTEQPIAAVAGAGSVLDVVTEQAPATAAGTAAASALATQIAIATAAGAGSVADVVTQIATAAAAGAGSVNANAGGGTGSAAGAGSVAAVVTEQPFGAAAGAAAASALATQIAIATAAGAGSVTDVVTQIAPGTAAGAGAIADVATQQVTGAATGAALVADVVTQQAIAAAAGAGAVSDVATQIATATAAGAAVASAFATQIAIAAAAGAGSVTDVVTQIAFAAAAGAGSVTAVGGTQGQSTGTAAGAAAVTAVATVQAPATAAGAGAVAALAVQQAPGTATGAAAVNASGYIAGLASVTGAGAVTTAKSGQSVIATATGAGTLAALAVQRAITTLSAAGAVTAVGQSQAAVIKGSSTGTTVTEQAGMSATVTELAGMSAAVTAGASSQSGVS
jgi:hypothetical protein